MNSFCCEVIFKWLMLFRQNDVTVMSISMNTTAKNNFIMDRKVIISRTVGYLILRICTGAIFQIEHWAPRVYAKYMRIVIIFDKIIYLQSLQDVLQQLVNGFHSWYWHTCQCLHYIIIFPFSRRGGKVSKIISFCNTGTPLKSIQMKCSQAWQQAIVVVVVHPSLPLLKETLGLSESEEILLKHPSSYTMESI